MAALDRVRMGGLLRCCIQSIAEAPAGAEGDEIPCQFHPGDGPQARFRDGAWEWTGAAEIREGRNGNQGV